MGLDEVTENVMADADALRTIRTALVLLRSAVATRGEMTAGFQAIVDRAMLLTEDPWAAPETLESVRHLGWADDMVLSVVDGTGSVTFAVTPGRDPARDDEVAIFAARVSRA